MSQKCHVTCVPQALTQPLVPEARGLTGDRVPCAAGSHSTLSAGGQGAYGGRSPLCRVPHKIEMFYNDMVKRSDKQKQTKTHQYHAKTDKERRTAYA